MSTAAENIAFNDVHAKQGVQIEIRHDGLVTWINDALNIISEMLTITEAAPTVDGICRMRIISDGLTVLIEIEDKRNAK